MGRRGKAPASRGSQHGGRSGAAGTAPGRKSKERRRKKGEYTGEDFDDLVRQLKPLGLAVRKMDMDGNCLFRAFADQVLGDCEEHQQFRDECCDLMMEQAEEFSLFHADDEDEESLSFEAYVQRMRHPGRWGSQLELMALCRHHNVNAIVHQSEMPSYEMGTAPPEARCIQLSYHDGEHYNSVRFVWDLEPGLPAQHLSLLQLRGTGGGNSEAEETEEMREVREFLPPDCEACATAIRAALVRAGGDATAAAEYLLSDKVCDADGEQSAVASAVVEHNDGAAVEHADTSQAQSEAAKRQARLKKTERKQAKSSADQKKLAISASEADEKMSLLAKQLLSV
eukprot:TRINITY_DN71553_c0_g1_i1.p1 TRINITY_DN71553_c0_g1~~TRINITY_DN71553_c0_g1_i1.p1  ORF type:complete len:340 (+),score=53.35 TRINITY_DN71553_c0_g1_i1:97-1116(+)